MSVEEVIRREFGEEFLRKYQQARARAEAIPTTFLDKIKEFAKEHMKDSDNFALKYENFDVLFVVAPSRDDLLEVRKTNAGNYKVTAIWYGSKSVRGPFISVFCNLEEQARKIVRSPNAPSLIVGKLRESTYEGDLTYNFRCFGVIPLGDEEAEDYQPTPEDLAKDEERMQDEEFEEEMREIANLLGEEI